MRFFTFRAQAVGLCFCWVRYKRVKSSDPGQTWLTFLLPLIPNKWGLPHKTVKLKPETVQTKQTVGIICKKADWYRLSYVIVLTYSTVFFLSSVKLSLHQIHLFFLYLISHCFPHVCVAVWIFMGWWMARDKMKPRACPLVPSPSATLKSLRSCQVFHTSVRALRRAYVCNLIWLQFHMVRVKISVIFGTLNLVSILGMSLQENIL